MEGKIAMEKETEIQKVGRERQEFLESRRKKILQEILKFLPGWPVWRKAWRKGIIQWPLALLIFGVVIGGSVTVLIIDYEAATEIPPGAAFLVAAEDRWRVPESVLMSAVSQEDSTLGTVSDWDLVIQLPAGVTDVRQGENEASITITYRDGEVLRSFKFIRYKLKAVEPVEVEDKMIHPKLFGWNKHTYICVGPCDPREVAK